jgi:metallo-beta-lactamase family protein
MNKKIIQNVEVKFLGAAATVTGSCYLIRHPKGQFLVDCGLFQGAKALRELNYQPFSFDAHTIDCVLLTHAHVDHSGLIPKLINAGFKGPIFATSGTRDLLTYMLPDSGYIQETEVERLNRRNLRRGQKRVEPIYTKADGEAAVDSIQTTPYDTWFEPAPGVRARLWNAGHILGSASIEIEVETDERPLRLLFSGDIGPQEKAFQEVPESPTDLDYLFMESTYGDRDRDDLTLDARREVLKKELLDGLNAGGNVLIPAFAVERTQELLYDIGLLLNDKDLPPTTVYLDSPLAIRATEVFESHADDFFDTARRGGLFRNPKFQFVNRASDSQALDRITSGAIIIAASGMCDAGRIRYHLKANLWRPQATVLFVGFQAPGSQGAMLLGGHTSVRIHGDEVAVRARIRKIDAYSAHADQGELVQWACQRMPVKRGIFLVHGEAMAQATLRDHLVANGCDARNIFIPRLDETTVLSLKGKVHSAITNPRLDDQDVVTRDWHNEYASFLVELSNTLRDLPNDFSRHNALKSLEMMLKNGKNGKNS